MDLPIQSRGKWFGWSDCLCRDATKQREGAEVGFDRTEHVQAPLSVRHCTDEPIWKKEDIIHDLKLSSFKFMSETAPGLFKESTVRKEMVEPRSKGS